MFDEDEASLEELERRVVQGAAEMSAHMAWWLAQVAEFDKREGWGGAGVDSCAHWLSWRCGIDPRTAREHVRVARALCGLPLVRSTFAEGRLSYSKVRAICRVATPANEELLVGLALDLSASQLERSIASYAKAHGEVPPLSLDDDAERRVRCGVTRSVEPDGLVRHEILSTPEDAAMIDLALRFGSDRLFAAAKAAARAAGASGDESDSEAARAAAMPKRPAGAAGRLESLLWIVRRGLANAERPGVVDDVRHLIVIHVEEGQALVTDDGRVDLGNGLVVHPRTLARLGCDGMFQTLLEDSDGNTLNLGRRARVATPNQKLVLMRQHPTCVFPGCETPVEWCQFHHIDPWGEGGVSDLDNYRPLCRHHHHLCHEGGWRLILDPGGRAVALPPGRGERLAPAPPLTDGPVAAAALAARNAARGVVATAHLEELGGRFGGEVLDRWALDCIVHAIAEATGPVRPTTVEVDPELVRGSPPSPN